MARLLEFVAGLVFASVVHLAGVRWLDGFSSSVDLFLLVALFVALGGRLLPSLFGGLVAGWVADAVTGGLFGLYGFANTLVGYGTAAAAQRLVIQRPTGVFLLFSLAAAVQQLVLVALSMLLLPETSVPGITQLLVKLAVAGTVGALGFVVSRRTGRWYGKWQRSKRSRLR